MIENLNSNNTENDEFTADTEETEYLDLIIRLKEIRSTIALLDKQYLEKL